ncbi:MAG: Glutaredoxin-like protein, YruB-family [archaeon GW2011_AR20]|nr:MAG: Glutaredoxin-like protein, YruB-family [archaeon GW2011_AR20]MBS3160930.1 glutathione S-transferase N-terminal domain-containing protein [Candidatus Woesearchaeota archaeon]
MTKEHKVSLYRTRSCIWCHKTAELFKEKGIKFKEVWVDQDHKAAQEMIKKSGQMGVPVIEIDGQIIVGYDVEAFKKLLKFN